MVYRKRTSRKKVTRRPRRRFTKRSRVSRRTGQKVNVFTRFVGLTSIVVDNVFGANGGYNFSLSDVPGYTEFTALYDSFKINAVKITFIPQMTQITNTGGTGNPFNARFFSVIDKNDDAAPSSANALREYKTCKWSSITKMHKRYIYKPMLITADKFSISTWQACDSPTVNYYGLKYFIEPTGITGVTTTYEYRVEAKYYLSFKNVR